MFYRYKSPILFKRCISLRKRNYRYFIGYLYNDDKVKPLHSILPKTSAYVKGCDGQTEWMYFLSEDDDLSKKINTI